jgi:hypothetical protein
MLHHWPQAGATRCIFSLWAAGAVWAMFASHLPQKQAGLSSQWTPKCHHLKSEEYPTCAEQGSICRGRGSIFHCAQSRERRLAFIDIEKKTCQFSQTKDYFTNIHTSNLICPDLGNKFYMLKIYSRHSPLQSSSFFLLPISHNSTKTHQIPDQTRETSLE